MGGWAVLYAAPLCSMHPWRSPKCKTRSGLATRKRFVDSWGPSRPGNTWANFRFQWSLLISNKLKLIDICAWHAHSTSPLLLRCAQHIWLIVLLHARSLTERGRAPSPTRTAGHLGCHLM